MAQDPSNNRDDGMERIEKMSFDDLPDIAIMQVMEKLDLRSRFMMRRVSKKLNGIQAKVKNDLETIRLKYPRLHHSGVLTVTERGFEPVTFPLRDDTVMEDAISRLAVNTHVNKMELITWERPILDAIANFEVDDLDIYDRPFHWLADEWNLENGRLLKINTGFGDFGWGVLDWFYHNILPFEDPDKVMIWVLIAVDPSSAADVYNWPALRPPQAGGEVVWEKVRMPINCVEELSIVKMKLPEEELTSKEAQDHMARMMKKAFDRFPSLPVLDLFKEMRGLR